MSKVLNISDGGYKIVVANTHSITLDVGPGGNNEFVEAGKVIVTGDLLVQGTATYLKTVNSEIKDNIIVLNDGETGSGIGGDVGTAGLRIDRGAYIDALWVFDESVTWTDTSDNGVTRQGTWSPRTIDGRILGIETVSITTNGNDLNLLGRYSTSGGVIANPGKVTVSGVGSLYHTRMTDDNDIPNKKYVDLSIESFFANTFQNRIQSGITPDAISSVRVFDNSADAVANSKIVLSVDGVAVQENYSNRVEMYGIVIEDTAAGSEIKTVSTSSQDLILSAMGTGSVVINDNLHIISVGTHEGDASIPVAPTDGTTIYSNNSGAGATGLYFVNPTAVLSNGTKQRDELISRNRALVYSMLF